jgi:hypothetical protein
MPTYFQDDDWDMVNYVINHKNGNNKSDVQDAIWYFIDHGYQGYTCPDLPDPIPAGAVWDMITDALNNGEGYVPPSGGWVAVICDAGEFAQHTFIEVDP